MNPEEAAKRAETNIANARRFAELALGRGDLSVFDELVADDVRAFTALKPDGWIEGKAMYRDIVAYIQVGFPDMAVTVTDAFASSTDPNRIALRFSGGGTHTGAMNGVAPTNLYLPLDETHLLRFNDSGQIIENVVGSNNPLSLEMLFADVIRPMVIPQLFPQVRLAPELSPAE